MAPSTGVAILDWFLSFLDAWGYLMVVFFTIFENLFVIGTLTPGETIVIAAAFVASGGGLKITLVWIASVIGTVAGSNISYFLGRKAGIDAVRQFAERAAATRFGRLVRIDPTGLDEIGAHFEADGSKTVYFSRFAVGAKNFVPAMAGAVGMPMFWYEFHTVLGAITYTTLMCAIGWFLGRNMDVALRVATSISWVGLLLLIAMLSLLAFSRRRARARKAAHHAALTGDPPPVLPEPHGEADAAETAPPADDGPAS